MVFKFKDWLDIDNINTENVFEYMENYIGHYQDAFNKIYKPNIKRDKLIIKMIMHLKTRGIGKKFALPYLVYDIDTWLENKNIL